jgi:hypothetical protein
MFLLMVAWLPPSFKGIIVLLTNEIFLLRQRQRQAPLPLALLKNAWFRHAASDPPVGLILAAPPELPEANLHCSANTSELAPASSCQRFHCPRAGALPIQPTLGSQ